MSSRDDHTKKKGMSSTGTPGTSGASARAETSPTAGSSGGLVVGSKDDSGSSGSSSRDSGEKNIRGRGGYRQQELITIPEGVRTTHASGDSVDVRQKSKLCANFVQLIPKEQRQVYKYRIDFEPDIESCPIRRQLFNEAARVVFGLQHTPQFDGYSEARCSHYLQEEETRTNVAHPSDQSNVTVKFKRVGLVQWGSFEMLRLYNFHMKAFLKIMGFFCVGNAGAYVHNDTEVPVGQSTELSIVRGFRTSANIYEADTVYMNLEPCHKMMQKQNVLQYMAQLREQALRNRLDLQTELRNALVGKLVVTGYNKFVYRVEEIDFNSNPKSKFVLNRTGEEIDYLRYFKKAHNLDIKDHQQPLIIGINNNRRKERLQSTQGDQDPSVKLVPELCNIAGLTDRQRVDNRLKMDMIRSTQVNPNDRLKHLHEFIDKLRGESEVRQKLENWGYDYATHPVKVVGTILPLQRIGIGRNEQEKPTDWPQVTHEASFDSIVMREKINVAPELKSIHVIISRASRAHERLILEKLKFGMNKIGLMVQELIPVRIKDGDAANLFVANLRQIPPDSKAVIIVLPNQDKEKYDAVKKYCSIERGLISQVVTTRLLTDERKVSGAVTKIGIQIAAKLGGEPWRIHFQMRNTMICGYDTYHDTLQRGKSFGAFIATINDRFTSFWSKADKHDKLDELSTQLATNVGKAMEKFREVHASKDYPMRVLIYRDGVSDGQIEHVFKVELESVKAKIKQLNDQCRLSFVIVNKRIGARFYQKQGDIFVNPSPGCVIDKSVTRRNRFDFYLISQHTRQGTVIPTYYNIIYENSALNAERHQILAYNLCYLYYNWTGSVRVPALCQYAHKLAYLCGEHLHSSPNANLDDRLHFL